MEKGPPFAGKPFLCVLFSSMVPAGSRTGNLRHGWENRSTGVPSMPMLAEPALSARPAQPGRATQSTCQIPQRMRSFMRYLLWLPGVLMARPDRARFTIFRIFQGCQGPTASACANTTRLVRRAHRASGAPRAAYDQRRREQEAAHAPHADSHRNTKRRPRPRAAPRLLRALRIVHPFPTLLNVAATAALAFVAARGAPDAGVLATMLLVMLCAQSAIGVTNDYFDRELDARTKPWKPIVAGLVAPGAALLIAVGLIAAACCAGIDARPCGLRAGGARAWRAASRTTCA